LGAAETTTIMIAIPEDTSPLMLAALSRDLAAAGFKKFMFVKPRQVKSTVESGRRVPSSDAAPPVPRRARR